MQENAYSSTTSASFWSLENAQASDLGTFSEHGYSLNNDSLYQDLLDFREKVKSLEDGNSQLREKLFSVDKLTKDDSADCFYTGFPNFETLMDVFSYLLSKLEHITYWRGSDTTVSREEVSDRSRSSKPGPKRKLSLLEKFVLVLMRLKVGLFLNDLADRFGISRAQSSKIFTTWINFLYHELPLLFPFPLMAKIDRLMPSEFERYPSTRNIIGCTELFIEVPSTMRAQSQTWSKYKHHNTCKALIGISPNGAITFVSKLWSGRVSDKEITQKCAVLALREPGDNIMADRGVDIHELLPPEVNLNIPPFKGTWDQLTPVEAEKSANIASFRIHGEGAICHVKNYHILDRLLPLSSHPIANQIFAVCYFLTNFLPFLINPANS